MSGSSLPGLSSRRLHVGVELHGSLVLYSGSGQLSALQPSWIAAADVGECWNAGFHPCRYDGQVFVKPPEVLARDRLLGTYEVRPVLARLR